MRLYGAHRRRGGANPLGVGVIAVGSSYYIQEERYFRDRYSQTVDMLARAFQAFKNEAHRPTLIIVDSHIGYGSSKQDSHTAHGEPLGEKVIADGFPMPRTMQSLEARSGATLILTIEQDLPLSGLFVQPTPLNSQGNRAATRFARTARCTR